MFQTSVVESRRRRRSVRSALLLPVSAVLHGMAAAIAIGVETTFKLRVNFQMCMPVPKRS